MPCQEPVKRGDGLVFDSGAPEGEEEGGTIFDMRHDHTSSGGSADAVLSFGQGQVNVGRVKARPLAVQWLPPECFRCHSRYQIAMLAKAWGLLL